uniref:Uncharacterized protein n=1 Tax=Solanum lycopersicum TaxID=4081 RepID=K4BUP5_SOLLC
MESPNLYCDESFEPIDSPIDLSSKEVTDATAGGEVLEDKDRFVAPIDPIDLSCKKVKDAAAEVIDDAVGKHEIVLEDEDGVFEALPILNHPAYAVHPEISQLDEDNFFEMKLRNEMEDHVKDRIISDPRMMVEHVFQLGEKLKLQKENVYIAVQLVNKSLLVGPVRTSRHLKEREVKILQTSLRLKE